MFVVAIETELNTIASCAETNVMTRNGYQIITENEVFFVSKERFLNKYKGNLYMTPGTMDRLLTFDEAGVLRDSVVALENTKTIKIKGTNRTETLTKDGARYSLSLPSSDVDVCAANIICDYSGNNSNIRIWTENSSVDATASNSTFDICANNTTVTMYISGCYVDLGGTNLKIMVIGNNNTICGIGDGITVFARGKKNEFRKRTVPSEQDPAKVCV